MQNRLPDTDKIKSSLVNRPGVFKVSEQVHKKPLNNVQTGEPE